MEGRPAVLHHHYPSPWVQPLLAIGGLWSGWNIGQHGLGLISALGPILLGVAALWNAYTAHMRRLADDRREKAPR